jgi:cyclophilin family peptidyl-prolyl cis-trans isomerase
MAKQWNKPFDNQLEADKTYTATLDTSHGKIEIELYPQDAPVAVNNFVSLAREGFYDGTPFHRIVKGFVIQGGDPTGTGAGGPGYKFQDETIAKDYEAGTVAMANAGPNTNGSQFFICLTDLRGRLPKNYTIFGKVTEGFDVAKAIEAVPTTYGRSGEPSTPTEPVTLNFVTIAES